MFHHRKSRLGNGIHYKSAGEEGFLPNEYDGNEATSGVLERRISASTLYGNSFCVRRVDPEVSYLQCQRIVEG